MNKLTFLLALVISSQCVCAQQLTIIPQPVSATLTGGNFVIDRNTSLTFNPADNNLKAAAGFFSSYIDNISGIALVENVQKKSQLN